MPNIVWIWLAAFVIFLILEIFTPAMIFVGFSIGALFSGGVAYFAPDAYYWQIGVFIIVSLALLPLTRKFATGISTEPPSKSNIDAMIDGVALVTKKIDPDLGGSVKFEGEVWRATANEEIEEGAKVVIKSVTGTKLNVERKIN